jgi:hypothetical protein
MCQPASQPASRPTSLSQHTRFTTCKSLKRPCDWQRLDCLPRLPSRSSSGVSRLEIHTGPKAHYAVVSSHGSSDHHRDRHPSPPSPPPITSHPHRLPRRLDCIIITLAFAHYSCITRQATHIHYTLPHTASALPRGARPDDYAPPFQVPPRSHLSLLPPPSLSPLAFRLLVVVVVALDRRLGRISTFERLLVY